MNKSVITNLVAAIVVIIGYQLNNDLVLTAGLFALSGAITNWLAIHMLFEKIPGVYGSGVIPLRFEDFKSAIKHMMMDQFFSPENIARFLKPGGIGQKSINLGSLLDNVDFNPTFNSLGEVIMESQFGAMLEMLGGVEALEPMKQPFIEKMKASVEAISESEEVKQAIADQLSDGVNSGEIRNHIEEIIELRLNELTPQLVKEMVQTMIKEHLGWLVVWGGILGGLIGVVAAFL
jgi:uncharacterized membrane protein YheB (UPF0754 family)